MDGDEEVGGEAGAEGPGGLNLVLLVHSALSSLSSPSPLVYSLWAIRSCLPYTPFPSITYFRISVSSDYCTNGNAFTNTPTLALRVQNE